MRTPFIAGNWKMYKTPEEARAFAKEFKNLESGDVRVAIAAPYTDLAILAEEFKESNIAVAAQNMHWEDEGAYTGEISAKMLKEIGVKYVIIGHSERREYFAETDETVNKKLRAAISHKLLPILCVGESLKTREEGQEKNFVKAQLEKDFACLSQDEARLVTIAYEPIWAIGTGKTASAQQAQDMCAFIRETIADLYSEDVSEDITIQYGGSVKPANASEILNMEDIDGALVGGASLKPADFLEIVRF